MSNKKINVYTPYQQKTINHILDTFQKSTRNRMLCADEVGLGKTFVAKGVIRGMAWDYLQKGKERLDVLYLCSNMNIAKQNKSKLGLKVNVEEDESKEENRTSMLYLQVLKGCVKELSAEELAKEYTAATGNEVKVVRPDEKIAISILPITPDTSLNIHSRPMGAAREREYILRMLEMYSLWDVDEKELEYKIKVMGDYSSNSVYAQLFNEFHKKYRIINNETSNGRTSGEKLFLNNITQFGDKLKQYRDEITSALCVIERKEIDKEEYKNAWKRLREIFSSITLDLIHYDVVILDEFQNFTKIIEKANSNAVRRNYQHNQKLFICKLLEQSGLGDCDYINKCKKLDGFVKELEVDSNKYAHIISQYKECLSDIKWEEWKELSEEDLIKKTEDLCLDVVNNKSQSQGKVIDCDKKNEAWCIARSIFFENKEKVHESKDRNEHIKRNRAFSNKISESMDFLWRKCKNEEKKRRKFFAWGWLDVVGNQYDFNSYYMKLLYEAIRGDIKEFSFEGVKYELGNTPRVCHPYEEINAWLVKKINEEPDCVKFFRKVRANLELYRNSLLSQKQRNEYLLDYFVMAEYLLEKNIEDIACVDVSSLELIYQFQWLKYYCENHRAIYTLQDDSEAELLDKIFAAEIPADEKEMTKILMLSATPFRLYMGTDDDDETEQPKETVETICDFLQRSGEIRETLQSYKREIKAFSRDVEKEDTENLCKKKEKFEESMHCYFTRMERNAILRKIGACELNANSDVQEEVVNKEIGELAAYTEQLGILLGNSAAAVRYGMQMPYALSFMPGSRVQNDSEKSENNISGYKIKTNFMARWGNNNLCQYESNYSLLDEKTFDNFAEPLGLFHGIFRDMLYSVLNIKDIPENENEPGAGSLLWIPPLTVPRDKLKGAFERHYGYGKTILFSSWIMVPRGIAVLFSYEVRRRLLHAVFPDWDNLKHKNNCIKIIGKICENIQEYIAKSEDEYWNGEDEICLRRSNLWSRLLESDISSVLAVWAAWIEGRQAGNAKYQDIYDILQYRGDEPFQNVDAFKLAEEDKPKILEMLKAYSENGCLDRVLQEYDYMNFSDKIELQFNFVKSTKLSITVRNDYTLNEILKARKAQEDKKTDTDKRIKYNFFARSIGSSKGDDEVNAIENLQKAFNSPFAPFVFATTSMGQEGLDFHNYADRIIHWNLPSNPVDFEQREGRINRRNCFAIRKKLIEVYAQDYIQTGCSVKEIFDNAFAKVLEQDFMKQSTDELVHCGMVPNWILPYKDADKLKVAKTQRIVPYFTTSNVMIKYHNNLKVLQLYRSVIGQPDPEELMERLLGRENGEEIVKELFMDFSPYRKNKETT